MTLILLIEVWSDKICAHWGVLSFIKGVGVYGNKSVGQIA